LKGIPTKPGYDRDEYPPAMSDEGATGANVRYVLSAENRSAGSVMRGRSNLTVASPRHCVQN
jgi:hypothetical protein